jgi:hypothetical protein
LNIVLGYLRFISWRQIAMAFENTITEQDMDVVSQQFVQGLRHELGDSEPDLSVDGMSESILSWILGLFGNRKS